jgi:hypothetical protein
VKKFRIRISQHNNIFPYLAPQILRSLPELQRNTVEAARKIPKKWEMTESVFAHAIFEKARALPHLHTGVAGIPQNVAY